MNDTVQYTRLSESEEYVTARDELRRAELDLTARLEQVAVLRRALPEGPRIADYVFLDAERREVRISELCSDPQRPLVIYHLMFGKLQGTPCPMCTMWIDGFNGVAEHLAQRLEFAVVAAAGVPELQDHAHRRGWNRLRVLSAGQSTFKFDLGSEDAEGNQAPRVSVFSNDGSGGVRHLYTGSPQLSPEREERGIDLLCPTWHLFDLLPEGRGDWYASLAY